MAIPISLTFTVMADEPGLRKDARWVSLYLAGVPVFTELVHDTGLDGVRSKEKAVENFARILASKLGRVLDDDS